jgi:arginine utilization protein RocB
MTKAETAWNPLTLRHYLARFNRKTKRYSKAIDMIANSIRFLIQIYSYLFLVSNAKFLAHMKRWIKSKITEFGTLYETITHFFSTPNTI